MGLACSSLCLQNVRLSFNGHKIMGFLHVFPTTPVWADCDVNRGSVVLSGDHKDALTCDNTHINLSFNKNKSATEGIQKMRSERREKEKMCKEQTEWRRLKGKSSLTNERKELRFKGNTLSQGAVGIQTVKSFTLAFYVGYRQPLGGGGKYVSFHCVGTTMWLNKERPICNHKILNKEAVPKTPSGFATSHPDVK